MDVKKNWIFEVNSKEKERSQILNFRVKLRIQPEQVTINIGKNAEIPRPPDGKESDRTVTWLTRWKDNVSEMYWYKFFT